MRPVSHAADRTLYATSLRWGQALRAFYLCSNRFRHDLYVVDPGLVNGRSCFHDMDSVIKYRERARHFRQLAEMTWQDDLEALLRRVAHDYDEVADDLEPALPRSATTS
jgi:hypothetical protein